MKVGSMSRGKRILLVTTTLLLAAHGLSAGLWRSRKAQPAPEAAAAATMSLTSVDSDASRVLLHTSGTPVYTSYSPSPDVFVVDLTGTTRPADLSIPATLPAPIASVAAEEAVEMGSRLTRVTFRFSQPVTPQASAGDKAVIVSLPASAVAQAPVSVAPVQVAPVAEAPHAEVVAEAPAPKVADPIPTAEAVPLPKAHSVRSIAASGDGAALGIDITGDGAMSYKAFRLNNPERLVIDLEGVKNKVAKSAIDVNSGAVARVRVGQFKSGADPVARVVIDLNSRTEYAVSPSGDTLRVTFGETAKTAASAPAPVRTPSAPKPVKAEPVKTAVATDIPSQVPTVAQDAVWKMPAKQVINAPADQTPPVTPNTRRAGTAASQANTATTTHEDVFNDAQTAARTPTVGGAPSGGRTLSGQGRVFTGDPISLNLKDADIKDVLRTFAQLTGLNIAVDPQVTGSVTVDVVDVPWDQVLDLILRQNGLTYVLEGNVMRVGTIGRLAEETKASRDLAEQERLNVPLSTVGFKLSYAKALDVSTLLKDIASPRAKVIVDQRTNQLIISEIPAYLDTIRNLIDTVDVPTRQVTIEARIVETTKTFSRSYGFTWNFGGVLDPALGNGTGLIFPNRVGYTGGPFNFGGPQPVIGLTLTDVLGTFNLDLALNAAENENLVKVISAPKVTTQDNIAAEIQSGVQIPYQTRVNFTTTVSYIDATLRLSVTPQITEAGTIIMDIAVQKTTPGSPIEGAAGTPLNTRQAHTRVMVRDGGTAVIGGIYQSSDTTGQSRVPVLHQIPILGALFRSNSMNTQHDELLIFITPRIVRGS